METFPLTDETLQKVFDLLPIEEQITSRLISPALNTTFLLPKNLQRVFYTVDGSTDEDEKNSTSTLIESSVPWNHIWFHSLNFNKNPQLFSDLCLSKCHHIRSLTFNLCQIELGTFIELIAACHQLKELRLQNSPSIYQTGYELKRWAHLFDEFDLRFSTLEKLELIKDESRILDHQNVLVWVAQTKNLKALTINSGINDNNLPFPSRSTLYGVYKNVYILEELELRGRYDENERFWFKMKNEKLIPLNLQSLVLDTINLKFLRGVLIKFELLKSLSLFNVKLVKETFDWLHENLSLNFLEIQNCRIEDRVLQYDFSKCVMLQSVKLANNLQKIIPNTEYSLREEYKVFFQRLLSYPESITLEGANITDVIPPIARVGPKYLNLSGCTGVNSESLRHLWDIRTTLKSLDLSHTDIQDGTFRGPSTALFTLANLEKLVLEGTNIGDETVESILQYIPHLKHLNLKDTMVTDVSLVLIMQRQNNEITELFMPKEWGEPFLTESVEIEFDGQDQDDKTNKNDAKAKHEDSDDEDCDEDEEEDSDEEEEELSDEEEDEEDSDESDEEASDDEEESESSSSSDDEECDENNKKDFLDKAVE